MSDGSTFDVPYGDIPQTMRDLLDEVYHPKGVEIWWNARTTWLGGASPRAMWTVPEGRKQVQQVVEMLVAGSFA